MKNGVIAPKKSYGGVLACWEIVFLVTWFWEITLDVGVCLVGQTVSLKYLRINPENITRRIISEVWHKVKQSDGWGAFGVDSSDSNRERCDRMSRLNEVPVGSGI